MALDLLLGPRPRSEVAIFANLAVDPLEALFGALAAELPVTERLTFPLPDELTARHPTPPSLMRQKHADLWQALTASERERVLLIAGPTAAYLAGQAPAAATTLIAVKPRRGATARAPAAWRDVLGPFPELDHPPSERPSRAELEDWASRIRDATRAFELILAPTQAEIATEVALALGAGPKKTARVAAAVQAASEPETERGRGKAGDWLDELLVASSRKPKAVPERKRRRGAHAL